MPNPHVLECFILTDLPTSFATNTLDEAVTVTEPDVPEGVKVVEDVFAGS